MENKQKKAYTGMKAEKIEFNSTDIITTSVGNTNEAWSSGCAGTECE